MGTTTRMQEEIQSHGSVIGPAEVVLAQWAEAPWVFAYGSLIWNPGFDIQSARTFTLEGWHRSLCIQSWKYRGTKEAPGLVLGLGPGGSCSGQLLLAAKEQASDVYQYLYDREMVTQVYDPVYIALTPDPDGPLALSFVARTSSPQYCKPPEVQEATKIILAASGEGGPNQDYVRQTYEHLKSCGIDDEYLANIVKSLDAFFPQ